MDKQTKARIQRLSKTLTLICRVVRVFSALVALSSLAAAVIAIFAPQVIEPIRAFFEQNTIFVILDRSANLSSMEPKYVAAIACFITSLTFFTLGLYAHSFQGFLVTLIESERPFTTSVAKQIRKNALAILLTVFYNPLIGIFLFLIVMLFSYLVDYGAYLQEKADETNRIQEEMIVSFAEITENKSGQTGQHIRRVSEYSKLLGKAMGLSPQACEDLRLASTMHDIGKLMIPSQILEKPGKLTSEEFETIKLHTTYGGELLKNVEGEILGLARTVALEHHERPDGRGYPEGKTNISQEGRIVAVADVYDALTSRRSYKEAWDENRAYQEIVNGSGTQFDPQVVDAFISCYEQIKSVREKYRDGN